MTEGDDERRGEDRAPITLRVDYKRLNTFFADYTKNISKGGTFIRTTRPLAIGTEFMFVLTVPATPATPSAKEAPPDERGAARGGKSAANPEGSSPPEAVQLELKGVVKWVVSEGDATADQPPGMGIQFLFANEGERRQVEDLVAGMMRSTLGRMLAAKLLGRDA